MPIYLQWNKYTQNELMILLILKNDHIVHPKATEKALIAWQYMEDAKRVRRSENLADLAQSLPSEIRRLATELENLTKGVRKMKYPDGTHIPSKAYTRHKADRATEITYKIIEKVDEYLRY